MTADHLSPQPPGTTIVFTATSSCPGTATYRFWVRNTAGVWQVKQDYSTTATFSWNTTGLPGGEYGLEVDVREQGSMASYEAVGNNPFTLAPIPCATPTLSASPVNLGAIGQPTTLTASTTGCANPRYRFWVTGPVMPWRILQDYSAATTFTYTSGGPAGAYIFEVDVRDAAESVSYDAVASLGYGIRGCGSTATLTPNPTAPQTHGTTITLTANATCPGTTEYRFWVRDASGTWRIVQDYGPSSTFMWNTTGLAPGTYGLEVDVRDVGSSDSYEVVANITYQLT